MKMKKQALFAESKDVFHFCLFPISELRVVYRAGGITKMLDLMNKGRIMQNRIAAL